MKRGKRKYVSLGIILICMFTYKRIFIAFPRLSGQKSCLYKETNNEKY